MDKIPLQILYDTTPLQHCIDYFKTYPYYLEWYEPKEFEGNHYTAKRQCYLDWVFIHNDLTNIERFIKNKRILSIQEAYRIAKVENLNMSKHPLKVSGCTIKSMEVL
jgi:hypothetical protein